MKQFNLKDDKIISSEGGKCSPSADYEWVIWQMSIFWTCPDPVRDNNASEFKPQNLNLGSGRGVNVEEAFQIFAGSFLGRQKTSQPEKG